MKKRSLFILILSILAISLIACNSNDENSDLKKVVIGVSPSPQSEIVNFVKEDLKQEGIELEIKEFKDYITPNKALDSGDIDLNFFQHQPYLEDFVAKENLDLVSIGGVHIEPMAIYSNTIEDIKNIKDGAEIAIPNDAVNGGRSLLLLEKTGLITLDPNAGIKPTVRDITVNSKNLKFSTLEAAILPRVLDDVDAAVINGNYALQAGFNPLKDSIFIEDKESPYVNIIAARAEDKDKEELLKVVEFLNTEKLREFLIEKYDGAVVPAF